jgi:hypothetical protein
MNITIERTPEQVELVKACASKNRDVAFEAQAVLAEFIGPVLAEVINTAPTVSNLFSSLQFNSEDNPSIPLDLYYDLDDEDYVQIWSQQVPGGLPTNTVAPSHSEVKFTTYNLDSAVSFNKRYASRSRLDVVSKTFTRIAQEILLKQEQTAANMIFTALAKAESKDSAGGTIGHVIRSAQPGRFLLADLNKLFTLAKRINTSWTGGTPESRRGRGITDLIVSPEIVEEIRGMAYNPISTKGGDGQAPASPGIAGTDAMREAVFSSAGIPEFYGVSIMEFNEMGNNAGAQGVADAALGEKWNKVYMSAQGFGAGNKLPGNFGGAGADPKPLQKEEQICLGIDLSRDSLIRAVAVDAESGSEFNLVVDDQFVSRQGKVGYYGSLDEGRVILDDRVLTGLVV